MVVHYKDQIHTYEGDFMAAFVVNNIQNYISYCGGHLIPILALSKRLVIQLA